MIADSDVITHMARLARAILLCLLVACSPGESLPDDQRASTRPNTVSDTAAPRPETIVDTLEIEGMPEVSRATLVRAPDGVDLPFSTYLPEGMDVQFPSQSNGAAVRFNAAFGGVVEPRAHMHVHMYAAGTTIDQARADVTELLAGRTVRSVEAPAWGLEAHAFDYRDDDGTPLTGRVIVARHGARLFHVVNHYPPEYGDGLTPRLLGILERWRWEDTGTMLTTGRPPEPRPAGP